MEDRNCAVCAQLIFMNFLLKMLSLRHTMEKSPFLLQRFFFKDISAQESENVRTF